MSASWEELSAIVAEALTLPVHARTHFVHLRCAADPELLRETLELLSWDGVSPEFLETPALDLPGILEEQEDEDWIGRRIGAYRITDLLGSGGMGRVFRATRDDGQFSRDAAIKIVDAAARSDNFASRFESERRILASLQHPNIARLYDSGVAPTGEPFVVMELLPGGSITRWADSRVLSTVDRVRLFAPVCEAVHYAHQRSVLHRDLKPANIVMGEDGQPRLVDFGLARAIDLEESVADHWATPGYASPEQLRDGTATTLSDVYSLGAVLFELVAGGPLSEAGPEPCTRVADRNLRAVIGKALQPEPELRYESALALQRDLQRWLHHEPVTARRARWTERIAGLVRRHPRATAATATIFVLTGLALSQTWLAWRRSADLSQITRLMLALSPEQSSVLPTSPEVRRVLGVRGLAALDSLSSGWRLEGVSAEHLASGYAKLAVLFHNKGPLSLNDPERADYAFQRARELYEAELERRPHSRRDRLLLADLLTSLGTFRYNLQRREEAVAAFESAGRLFQTLDQESSSDPLPDLGLLRSRFLMEFARIYPDRSPEMRRLLGEARVLAEREVAAHPGNSERLRRAAHVRLRSIFAAGVDSEEALDHLNVALPFARELVRLRPADPQAADLLVNTLFHLARNARVRGDAKDWERFAANAEEVLTAWKRREPGNPKFPENLCQLALERGKLLMSTASWAQAEAQLRRALAMTRDLPATVDPAERSRLEAEVLRLLTDARFRQDAATVCALLPELRQASEMARRLNPDKPPVPLDPALEKVCAASEGIPD